jgi:hypothetical protein
VHDPTPDRLALIQINAPSPCRSRPWIMIKPDEPSVKKEPRPSRLEEARKIIEEYANDLREIIRKLRRNMN